MLRVIFSMLILQSFANVAVAETPFGKMIAKINVDINQSEKYNHSPMFFSQNGNSLILNISPSWVNKNIVLSNPVKGLSIRIEKNESSREWDLIQRSSATDAKILLTFYMAGSLLWERTMSYSPKALSKPWFYAAIFDSNMQLKMLCYNIDNDNFLSYRNILVLIDAKNGNTLERFNLPADCKCGIPYLSPDLNHILLVDRKNIVVLDYNITDREFKKTAELRLNRKDDEKFSFKDIRIQGKLAIITSDTGGRGTLTYEQRVIIYDIKSKRVVLEFEFFQREWLFTTWHPIYGICISPDGNLLALHKGDHIYIYELFEKLGTNIDIDTLVECMASFSDVRKVVDGVAFE